jgi:hypothetical protein
MSHTAAHSDHAPPVVPNKHPGQHPHHSREHGEEGAPKKSWALLAVALATQILVVLDISVVNTACPPSDAR